MNEYSLFMLACLGAAVLLPFTLLWLRPRMLRMLRELEIAMALEELNGD